MLTKLSIHAFKRFDHVEIELGSRVVFIGPNNSGKSTALQALALWDVGLRKWQEKRGGTSTPTKRPGVTINRNDLISVPVPDAKLLWKNLHVRETNSVSGKQRTRNVTIAVTVTGVSDGEKWECGLEFDYANAESFYCRPLRLDPSASQRMPIPPQATAVQVAFLPPMSGLAATEHRLDPGAIRVLLGEGRTDEVLRNLCYQIAQRPETDNRGWNSLSERVQQLFGIELVRPEYIPARGEIEMEYRETSGLTLDITCSGRGLQQTVLLLAHLYANPSTILLLDEPDAHLEILRQRQIYQVLSDVAREHGSQIIAASHSEVLLDEAAGRDVVVAFVGSRPHRIDDRGSQVLKSLREIGFDQFYLAEQTGFVLYLEGSTDLAILRAFAKQLDHPVSKVLDRPFVKYVQNQPSLARQHFFGLREGKPDLVGFALFDGDAPTFEDAEALLQYKWSRFEIESYLCDQDTLLAFAEYQAGGELFTESARRAMKESIEKVASALEALGKGTPWTEGVKASTEFLEPVFQNFYRALGLPPNLMNKSNYHELAPFVRRNLIPPEVEKVLGKILKVAKQARPMGSLV